MFILEKQQKISILHKLGVSSKAHKRRITMDQQQETTNNEMQKSNTPYSKSLIGIVIALIILAFAAGAGFMTYYNSINKPQVKIENPTTNKPDTQTEDTADSQITKEIKKLPSSDIPPASNLQGGILLSKDGYGKQAAGAPTVATYFDPLCPGCGSFNRTVDETLIKMVEAGQINLELHPMSFLNRFSSDQYSYRVSGGIAYIASHDNDPKHLLQFINSIFSERFQPEEGDGYQATPNKALIDLAEDAGVADKIANEAFNLHYVKWQEVINENTPEEKALWNVSGSNKGAMTTPTVTINGKLVDLNAASEKQMDPLEAILKSLGIDKKYVGKSGHMPKVTYKSKPLEL